MSKNTERTPADRKFIGLHEDIHAAIMRIAKKTQTTGSHVIGTLLDTASIKELETRLLAEREKRNAIREKQKEQQKLIMGKLSKLSSEELDKLLANL